MTDSEKLVTLDIAVEVEVDMSRRPFYTGNRFDSWYFRVLGRQNRELEPWVEEHQKNISDAYAQAEHMIQHQPKLNERDAMLPIMSSPALTTTRVV